MKRPLRALSLFLVPALLAGVCACSTAAAGNAASVRAAASKSPRAAPGDEALLSFATGIGVSCQREGGRLACIGGKPEVGDYADVELHPDCGRHGLFGLIDATHPVELRDRISPLDTRTIATLMKGQAVCIRGIGRAGDKPFYYFVSAIPKTSIPQCGEADLCNSSPVPTIRWIAKKPRQACSADTRALLLNCASGWIQADELHPLSQSTIR